MTPLATFGAPELFEETLRDLDACARSHHRYQHRRLAALLRLLLFDPYSQPHRRLAPKVADLYGVPLEFRLAMPGPNANPTVQPPLWTHQALGLEVEGLLYAPSAPDFGHWPLVRLNLEQLLKEPALRIGAERVPLKHLIENVAYVGGVVHDSDPNIARRQTDELLTRVRRELKLPGDADIGVLIVHHVSLAIRRSLEPLYQRVIADRFGGRVPKPFDYDGTESMERRGDEWVIEAVGERWVVREGRYRRHDAADPGRDVSEGTAYLEYQRDDGERWRVYSATGPKLPTRIESLTALGLFVLRRDLGVEVS